MVCECDTIREARAMPIAFNQETNNKSVQTLVWDKIDAGGFIALHKISHAIRSYDFIARLTSHETASTT